MDQWTNGFFTKCAEANLPYDAAVGLYKLAWQFTHSWDDVRNVQEGLRRDMVEKGIDEAYLKSMGRRGKRLLKAYRNPRNLHSTWLNRHLNPFSYNAKDELRNLRSDYQNLLGERERMRQRTGAGAAAQPAAQPYGGGYATPTAQQPPKDLYSEWISGKKNLDYYPGVSVDANGEYYRTDGKPLPLAAQEHNHRMQHNRGEMDAWRKSHPASPAAPAAVPAPQPAPKPKYDPAQERQNQAAIDLMNGNGAFSGL